MRLELQYRSDLDLSQPAMQVDIRNHIARCLRDFPHGGEGVITLGEVETKFNRGSRERNFLAADVRHVRHHPAIAHSLPVAPPAVPAAGWRRLRRRALRTVKHLRWLPVSLIGEISDFVSQLNCGDARVRFNGNRKSPISPISPIHPFGRLRAVSPHRAGRAATGKPWRRQPAAYY